MLQTFAFLVALVRIAFNEAFTSKRNPIDPVNVVVFAVGAFLHLCYHHLHLTSNTHTSIYTFMLSTKHETNTTT
jgi:hypothetical protein